MRTSQAVAVLVLWAAASSARHLQQDSSPSPAPNASAAPASFPTYAEALTAATALGDGAPISIFLAAVQAANLTTALDNGKPYTILAPTNASFAAALSKLGLTQEALLADKPLLTKILSYHVIPGAAVLSTQLNDGQKVDTLLTDESTRQPAQLTVKVKGSGGVEFDGASSSAVVVIPDIKAGNTVVHVIDTVLVPPGVAPAATSGRK